MIKPNPLIIKYVSEVLKDTTLSSISIVSYASSFLYNFYVFFQFIWDAPFFYIFIFILIFNFFLLYFFFKFLKNIFLLLYLKNIFFYLKALEAFYSRNCKQLYKIKYEYMKAYKREII
jgi:magnesium-transporting ATPase (P-type)